MAEKRKEVTRLVTKRKPDRNQTKKLIVLFLALLVCFYLGFAGWTRLYYEALTEQALIAQSQVDCNDPNVGVTYNDITYCTREDYDAAQQVELMQNAGLYWIFLLPDPLHALLSAFAFGVAGSLIRMIGLLGANKPLPDFQPMLAISTTGGMTAILLLGIYYLFPGAFPGALKLKPVLQPFLSLLAGVYSAQIQKWLQSLIRKSFGTGKEKT